MADGDKAMQAALLKERRAAEACEKLKRQCATQAALMTRLFASKLQEQSELVSRALAAPPGDATAREAASQSAGRFEGRRVAAPPRPRRGGYAEGPLLDGSGRAVSAEGSLRSTDAGYPRDEAPTPQVQAEAEAFAAATAWILDEAGAAGLDEARDAEVEALRDEAAEASSARDAAEQRLAREGAALTQPEPSQAARRIADLERERDRHRDDARAARGRARELEGGLRASAPVDDEVKALRREVASLRAAGATTTTTTTTPGAAPPPPPPPRVANGGGGADSAELAALRETLERERRDHKEALKKAKKQAKAADGDAAATPRGEPRGTSASKAAASPSRAPSLQIDERRRVDGRRVAFPAQAASAEAEKEQLMSAMEKEVEALIAEERAKFDKDRAKLEKSAAKAKKASKSSSKQLLDLAKAVRAAKADVAAARAAATRDLRLIPAIAKDVAAQLVARCGGVERDLAEAKRKYHKELAERKRLHNLVQELRGNIRVFCRVRPVSPRERENAGAEMTQCVEFPDDGSLHVKSSKKEKTFEYPAPAAKSPSRREKARLGRFLRRPEC